MRVKWVVILDAWMDCFLFGKKVCVIDAEQTKIWESAVEMHAEKIPANIMPTKNVGKYWRANSGSPSSGSWFINSGKRTLAASPIKIAAAENTIYQLR